jgi:hypothetical protein
MMNKCFLFLTTCIVLVACHSADKELNAIVINSDSAAIIYYSPADTVETRIIRDKQILDKLADFVSAEKTDHATICGYNGSIHFFKQDSVVQDIYFNMYTAHCNYFIYKKDGQPAATVLSPEAKQLLESLGK